MFSGISNQFTSLTSGLLNKSTDGENASDAAAGGEPPAQASPVAVTVAADPAAADNNNAAEPG